MGGGRCRLARHRRHRRPGRRSGAPARLSQAAQVVSSRPAVTSLPCRTSGRRSSRGSASSRSDDPRARRAQVARPGIPVRARRSCRAGPRRRGRSTNRRSSPGRDAGACGGPRTRSATRRSLKNRSAARVAWSSLQPEDLDVGIAGGRGLAVAPWHRVAPGYRAGGPGYHRSAQEVPRDGLVHGQARRSTGFARPCRDGARRARRQHHRHRRRGRGHRRRADADDLRRRRDARGVRRARACRSRSTTRPAASNPTRCPSATSAPAPPAAARSADAAEARRRAGQTAAIRFDIVDRRRGDLGGHRAVAVELGGRIRTLATVRQIDGDPPLAEIELEVEGVSEDDLVAALERARGCPRRPPDPGARQRSSASGSSSSAAAPRSPRWPSAP